MIKANVPDTFKIYQAHLLELSSCMNMRGKGKNYSLCGEAAKIKVKIIVIGKHISWESVQQSGDSWQELRCMYRKIDNVS